MSPSRQEFEGRVPGSRVDTVRERSWLHNVFGDCCKELNETKGTKIRNLIEYARLDFVSGLENFKLYFSSAA